MKNLLAMVLFSAVMYLAGVLAGQSFTPWEWEDAIRGLIALFWATGFFIVIYICDEKNN